MCLSPAGAYDLSGNVKEWTSDPQGTSGPPNNEAIYVVRGGSYESPRLGLTCQTALSQATASTVLDGLGFRCCSDVAP
jgi:formylglycine-generating enzyme required for sulfatase activity